MSLADRWSAILDRLHAERRYRSLHAPHGVDFASNDYLGYGSGNRFAPRADDPNWPAPRSGLASRLLRGHHPIWEEVEAALADWHGVAAALMMTSGYMANEGLLATVIEPQDWVASDALNHASIIDGVRMARAERFVYRHLDLDHLEAGLRTAARGRPPQRQLFVVTESLFSMDGDLAPLERLVSLAERYGAHVIVDEAHATGCFGPSGAGLVDAAGLRNRVLATVHTGGKALGVPGAYVCGPARLRELLINRSRHFIFTTALPAAVGTWWLEVVTRARSDHAGRTALHAAAAKFRARLARHQIAAPGRHYIVPVLLGAEARAVQVARRLQDAGWDIRAIRPPTVPPGTARLRISIHADHAADTLAAVADAVAAALADGGLSTGSA
jgi:8-amino-7-oxononanoate synthase